MIGLTIRSRRPEGEATLYTRVRIDGKSKWIDLHLPVDVKKWQEVSTSLKKQTNYLDRLGYSKKIADIEFAIKELRQRNCLTEESINETILNTALVETRERIKKQDELQRYISDRQNKSVKTWIKDYIAKIESGEARTYDGKRYAANTIRIWKQFLRIFLEIVIIKKIIDCKRFYIIRINNIFKKLIIIPDNITCFITHHCRQRKGINALSLTIHKCLVNSFDVFNCSLQRKG